MVFHILNGEALKDTFPFDHIDGEIIVIREAFIDGPVSAVYDSAFWSTRKTFIQKAYHKSKEQYDKEVMSEFNRLQKIESTDEVYLWFEDDLFCQCNMWFAVDYIFKSGQPTFYRVFPEPDTETWRGFGLINKKELLDYYSEAMVLNTEDVLHLRNLWNAFVHADNPALLMLSEKPCNAIRFQKEVIKAQADRAHNSPEISRPHRTLATLIQGEEHSFYQIFEKFARQEGIYGFGDSQVRNMLKELDSQKI